MSDDVAYVPELPEHPELREIALLIEGTGMMGEILDERFRCYFIHIGLDNLAYCASLARWSDFDATAHRMTELTQP